MNPRWPLLSANQLRQADGWFDLSTFGMHLDGRFLTGGPSIDRVPAALLAHEAAHVISTATTAVGLRDFLGVYLAEGSAWTILERFVALGAEIPRGGVRESRSLSDNPDPELLEAYMDAHLIATTVAVQMGDIDIGRDELGKWADPSAVG